MRQRETPKGHRLIAIIGIVAGLLLAIYGAWMSYEDWGPGKSRQWMMITLPALPMVALGCIHLARLRGYSSAAAYGLFAFAAVVWFFVGNRMPRMMCFGFVFVTLLPTLVLLTLPKRTRYLRRW